MGSKDTKIAVAMSGGVDSTVAAALLLEGGHSVVGATLRLQAGNAPGCAGTDAEAGAAEAARRLDIGHHVVDCVEAFENMVLRRCWEEYVCGRTPSPCLVCNERIKFGILLDWALQNGCGALATGHYARIGRAGGEAALLRGADGNKDQSYFLAGLGQGQLSRLLFPLGSMEKPAVKAKAAALGLPCAERRESQDACFLLPGLSFQESLERRFGDGLPSRRGCIVDWRGKSLGGHGGVHHFTVGQRRGVKVGAGERAWVRSLDAATGEVRLTNDPDDLLCDGIGVSGLSWCSALPPRLPLECGVQVRYRAAPVPATLLENPGGGGWVAFKTPVRAAAPGQAAVFYDGDRALGRGWMVI